MPTAANSWARRRTVLLALVLLLGAVSAVLAVRSRAGEPARTAEVGSGAAPAEAPGAPPAVAGLGAVSASPSVSVGASAPASAGSPSSSPRGSRMGGKKGVSTYEWSGNRAALADVRASWYYNWSPRRESTPGPATVEFVPMIWGASSVTDGNLAQARQDGNVLLGFNEPDLGEQANMSVEQALDLWPRLEDTGMRLGSPVVAFGGDKAGGWLDRFMSGARARGYRVDFIALHWYGSDFRADAATGHLRGYLQAVYQRYRLPIWLTEYSLINFSGSPKFPSGAEQAAFVRASTAMLGNLSFVERYAWFALPSTRGAGTGLYRDNGTPTEAGAAYRSA
ncbi:glycoside hydrolase family protein [Virgisporangium ochraceum]|uniref:Asl1-like glycosyl hydrolase catalytic domain-containing protein n=1 Tax=Virgisporangium ochraceum TaxID=65505 RepID=A0A8J3ZKU9_9ACTN|nr:glycoside hydrolase family protein [Virgisporangium ochraceum]GIJ65942.1 hypothetical protein Voc01_008590 [Virgisporangium ochraceum]